MQIQLECGRRHVLAAVVGLSVLAAGATVRADDLVVVGVGGGGGPQVKAYDPPTYGVKHDYFAGPPAFLGGVRVAAGDVTGDGVSDVLTVPGPGGSAQVTVRNGATGDTVQSFFAYAPAFTGGAFVAAGDVNRDGRSDIVTGADAGGAPLVSVFDAVTGNPLLSFNAFATTYTGGVRVAAGDVNHDGVADIIAGVGSGTAPEVRIFDGKTSSQIRSFFAFPLSFTGGVYVAAGDVNGDGFADVITGSGPGGGPQVSVYDGATGLLLRGFFAYNPAFTGGVRVASADVNGDGLADIITGAGPGGGPQVSAFDGRNGALLTNFFAFDPAFTGGVFVGGDSVVPEPSTMAAIAMAMLGMTVRRRRR